MAEQQFEDLNHYYYHLYYQFQGRSNWMEKIWSEAFGEAYPKGLEHYGYVTRNDLRVFSEALTLPSGSKVLDIGCGKGGPGLFLAQENDWELTGIDLIPAAVEQASQFKAQFQLKYPANFLEGRFYNIPVADDTMDAVISFDSLWATPDKIEALRNVKRVLKPGGKFMFTHWDLLAQESVPLLQMSGLSFVSREETSNWIDYQRKVYEGISQYQNEIFEEMGDAARMLFHEASASPPYLDQSVRRIYLFEKPVQGSIT